MIHAPLPQNAHRDTSKGNATTGSGHCPQMWPGVEVLGCTCKVFADSCLSTKSAWFGLRHEASCPQPNLDPLLAQFRQGTLCMPCLDNNTACSNDSFLPAHRGAALVIAKPRTGRTHQVRLHTAHTTVTHPTLQLHLRPMFWALAREVNDCNSLSTSGSCAACVDPAAWYLSLHA